MEGVDGGVADVESVPDLSSVSAFEQAVAHAIAESLSQVDGLQVRVNKALAVVDAAMDCVGRKFGTEGGEDVAAVGRRHSGEVQSVRDAAVELFERQRAVLGSVNIALFGRTGAGKSSLIEALTRGDGLSISTGESDFTKEVREACWRGCKVIDTPGTQGWGRSESRDTLERRAGRAVEVADVVLLCFDSQSQQEGEFLKVSEWVREHGKPVVAILNVRNPMWRRRDKVRLYTARSGLSASVRQHASHIAAELNRLGLFDVPVVAINAQRAAYARVEDEYRGPAVAQFQKLRGDLGADGLLHVSHLDVLEDVIADALASHATELRLGMLNNQVRALFDRLAATMANDADEAERRVASQDQTIERLFSIMGYPLAGSEVRVALPKDRRGMDLLLCVERYRGEPYQAAACGRVEHSARQWMDAHLGCLRSESLKQADDFVALAFDEGRNVEPDAFVQAVFDSEKTEVACGDVFAAVAALLREEVDLVVEESRLDLQFDLVKPVTIKGNAGKTRRLAGYGAGVAGVASGVTSIALLDPEPISKLLLGGAAVAAWGLNSLSKRLRKGAEASRQAARGEANAAARGAINELYDGIDRKLADAIAAVVREAMLRLLKQPLFQAGKLRVLMAEGRAAAASLRALGVGLQGCADAQRVLSAASRRIAALRGASGELSVSGVLLGEGWITDPVGLDASQGTGEFVRTRAYDPGRFSGLFDRLNGFFEQLSVAVVPGAGARWLDEVARDCVTDNEATAVVDELRVLRERARPGLLLFGDYSSGKTSFVKRLLIDAGLPLPSSLEVRADPATDGVRVYEWADFDLIDTPGLQSGVEGHAEATMAAWPDASVVVCLLPPNLLVGSTDVFERLLKGDRDRGLAAKLDRTIFVIHRSDEFGTSPDESPDEYLQLCERKKQELCGALAARGVMVDIGRVFCMAADPYQLVGDRRDVSAEQFDPYRAWDGFTEFHKAARKIAHQFRGTGVDRALLDGGLARFGRLDAVAATCKETAESAKETFTNFGRNSTAVIGEGRRLGDQWRARIRGLVEDHMYAHLDRASASSTEAELLVATEELKRWWESVDFQADVDRWQNEAVKSIDGWRSQGLDRLGRPMASARFRSAVAASDVQFESLDTASGEYGWMGKSLNAISKPLKGATRDAVYKLGKAVGIKFKPYGAINAAKTFAKAGVVLSAVAAGVDAVILGVDWKNEGQRAAGRKKLQECVKHSADEITKSLTEADDESAGPIAYLGVGIRSFEDVARDNDLALATVASDIAAIDDRRGRYRVGMERAWTAIDVAGLQA